MSCFKGRMREYRNISIDRFDGENLKSTAFFLSHVHSDHTVGLEQNGFLERLQSSGDVVLYCSDITKLLLLEQSKFSHLEQYVRVLPVDEPTNVSIPQPGSCKIDTVQVTLLHAAHCPGSVMFLFEGSEGTCLYTGDFRWENDKISNISALHEEDKSVKHIDSLYIDTTFCHESSIYIPSRDDSANAVYHLVTEWIAKGPNNVVHFTPRSQYGHEHLLKDVYVKTGHKIHVAQDKYKIYQKIPGLEDVFTSESSTTPIHACKGKWSSCSLPCGDRSDKLNVMVILPSTMYFTMRLNLDLSHIVERKGFIHRVCYSFHSSYIEVKDLVTYLQPKFVRPNVKPFPDETILKVQGRLNEFLKLNNSKKICDSQKIKPLGKLRRSKFTMKRTYSEHSSESFDLCFGTPEKLPPSPKKTRKMEDIESDDEHSSYAGSVRSDTEMSDICEFSDGNNSETIQESLSLPGESLLAALDYHDSQVSQGSDPDEPLTCRVCLANDEEQLSAVVVPSSQLDEDDYKNVEEESCKNDKNEEDSRAKGDNPGESVGKVIADEEEFCPIKEGCETLSTPGQSLLQAAEYLESTAQQNEDIKSKMKGNRSDSYEDKFMMFLTNDDENHVSQNEASLSDLDAEKEIDRWILNSRNSENCHNESGSQHPAKNNTVHQDAVENVSEQAIDKNVIPENMNGKSGCSIKINQDNGSDSNEHEAIIIDSSCSTINTCESIPTDVDSPQGYRIESDGHKSDQINLDSVRHRIEPNGHKSDKNNLDSVRHRIDSDSNKSDKNKMDSLGHRVESDSHKSDKNNLQEKGSLEDLFGTDNESNSTMNSDDEIIIKDDINKTAGTNKERMIKNSNTDSLGHRVESDKNNLQEKGSLEDLFGTDNESNSTMNSNDEIIIKDDMNKTAGTNNERIIKNSNTGVNGLKNGCLSNNTNNCVVLCEDSDEEETEWSLLSGKKSLSRNNSLQYQDLVNKNGNAVSENVVKKVITAAVNKLSSLGHCENTAIVLDGDDLSDSDGTIPPSQQSNASIETISPFPTPIKHDPIKDQRSNGDTGVSSCLTSHCPINKSPMKNQTILPYLSPVKNKSPRKLVCQVGDMYILNNGNDAEDETTESSTIDLTASDDDEGETDDAMQDYFVLD